MGNRLWPAPKNEDFILVQTSDMDDNSLRLKEFANVTFSEETARVEDFERSDRRQIIHWVLDHHSKDAILLVVKDNQIERRSGRLEDVNLELGNVVQLERVGFARVTKIMDDGTPIMTYLHD